MHRKNTPTVHRGMKKTPYKKAEREGKGAGREQRTLKNRLLPPGAPQQAGGAALCVFLHGSPQSTGYRPARFRAPAMELPLKKRRAPPGPEAPVQSPAARRPAGAWRPDSHGREEGRGLFPHLPFREKGRPPLKGSGGKNASLPGAPQGQTPAGRHLPTGRAFRHGRENNAARTFSAENSEKFKTATGDTNIASAKTKHKIAYVFIILSSRFLYFGG